MDGNHSASVAAPARPEKKKKNKVSERKKESVLGGVAPPPLISANGFCRARRELYALIMQGAGAGAAAAGTARIGESARWKCRSGWDEGRNAESA